MTEQDKANIEPNSRKRRLMFIAGITIGLLTGAAVTMLLVDWLDYKRPTVVKVLDRSENAGTKDTVVNYVIHKYEEPGDMVEETIPSDSLSQDSLMVEEDNSDFMLEMDDADEAATQNVLEEKMIKKNIVKIIYLDENKHVIPAPAGAPGQWQVQQWSTPIKNKIAYLLAGNMLKVKGLDVDNLKVVQYNNHFYLLSGNHVYEIKPNKQYDKLVEAPEVSFPIK